MSTLPDDPRKIQLTAWLETAGRHHPEFRGIDAARAADALLSPRKPYTIAFADGMPYTIERSTGVHEPTVPWQQVVENLLRVDPTLLPGPAPESAPRREPEKRPDRTSRDEAQREKAADLTPLQKIALGIRA